MMVSMRNFISFLLIFLGSFACLTCGKDVLSCLSSGGVQNLTTISSPTYAHFLDLSLYNLIYSGPHVLKPFAIILPEDRQQLVVSVQCCRKWSWVIRLRSGGHSFESMSSVADDPFVIIDLINLNRVTVDLDSETAWVEGGATMGELYYAIGTSSKAHAASAGIAPTVGIGGHFSGGGNGFLARKYGLAADNVVDAILIDADGRVHDRESMGEDVFWAIRGGGGGGWGAVYAWKIRLLPVPETVSVFYIFRHGSISSSVQLVNKWQMVAPVLEDDFYLAVLAHAGTNANEISLLFMGLYLGPKASAFDSITRAFPQLGVLENDFKEMSWVESTLYLWTSKKEPTLDYLKNRSYPKVFCKSKFDFVMDPVPESRLEGALEMLAKQPKGMMTLIPYGGMLARIGSEEIAFPHREGNLYGIFYFSAWEEEEDRRRDAYLGWIRGVYEYMTPFVSKNPRRVYVNVVDLDLGVMDWKNRSMYGEYAVEVARPWEEKYFHGNYDRLVRAKTLIDPDNVFRHPQSIPPLSLVPSDRHVKVGWSVK
ncbi:hypothetical protein AAC387_Pa03g4545 [Persea americana]